MLLTDSSAKAEFVSKCDNDEVKRFLRDVLTLEELQEAVRRFDVARRLYEGETFKNIEEETKVSSTTISRVNHWLHHGKRGYKLVLERQGFKENKLKEKALVV